MSGVVKDGKTDAPLPYAMVTITGVDHENDLEITVDSGGRFYVVLPTGKYRLVASSDSHTPSYKVSHI